MSNIVVTEDKVQLIKEQICKGASDGELQLFIELANRTRLDPFARQCWAVQRWDHKLGKNVMVFQTSIDGFRVIAERSDKYQGQVGPFWCGPDGVWKDVWLEDYPPTAAKVGVVHKDFKDPLYAVAKFSSFAVKKKDGSLTPIWQNMPEVMLAKCAEAQALRKAFPQDLSGLYSEEEMGQAEREVNDLEKKRKAARIQSMIENKEVVNSKAPDVEVIALHKQEEMPPFDEFTGETKVVSLGDYVLPEAAKKFKGKKLSEVNKDEFCQYIVEVRSWFDKEKKPVSKVWKEIFANAESYFG